MSKNFSTYEVQSTMYELLLMVKVMNLQALPAISPDNR